MPVAKTSFFLSDSLQQLPRKDKVQIPQAYDIMSASEREQAQPAHRERRIAITGFACDILITDER